jgi:hypothetical protein
MYKKIDKVRAHREELKRLLFSVPTKGRKVVKTITVTMMTNKHWKGYGNVSRNNYKYRRFNRICKRRPVQW